MRFALALVSIAFAAVPVLAAGPEKFTTINQLKEAEMYHLTCSAMKEPIQAHVMITVEHGAIADVQIFSVAPSESINVLGLDKKLSDQLTLKLNDTLTVKGQLNDGAFNRDFDLEVKDGAKGLVGTFVYDNGDGVRIDRKVFCSGVNYMVAPDDY